MEDHELAFYQSMARQHRGTSRQVGAWSEPSQTARFDVMFDVLDSLLGEGLAGLSILDFGCGKDAQKAGFRPTRYVIMQTRTKT